MEKAFAKLNGNYEYINYGWQSESQHILTGAPTTMVTLSSINKDVSIAWNDITTALMKNFLVGCDTSSTSLFGLPTSHAYSIMGAYTLKDSSGKVVHRLLRVRNPWATDYFNGPWSDASSLWTADFKS